ncbi:MAG: hypothetical protein ACLTPN_02590 [Clostridia bacterium]|jgi:hypothetical protein
MPIIFDEIKHAKEVIEHGTQTVRNKNFELQLVANYLRKEGYSDIDIEEELHRISKKYFKDYNRIKMYNSIDKKVKKSKKAIPKIAYPVKIYQEEIDIILSEDSIKCQKLMFVYLVLAKYYMSNVHSDKYYVGCKDNDIFKLCDMYVRKQEKLDLMHYLTKKGYITPTLSMSSIVNYVKEDGEVVLEIIPDQNMIYYFEKEYLDGIFINCEICGKLVKKTNNRIKYCKKCAQEVNKTKTLSNTYSEF